MSDADYYRNVPIENAVCRIRESDAIIKRLKAQIEQLEAERKELWPEDRKRKYVLELEAERDALLERLAVHEQMAKEFTAKVESMLARSEQIYDAMKAALKGEVK